MRWYKADLHIHSVLSPCGSLEMAPKAMMQKVSEAGIDIIAITDHNSMSNCLAYQQVAKEFDITCVYGVEVQSAEEIHAIVLFDDWQKASSFASELYDSLLPIDNDPDYFGDQVVINSAEEIVRFEERALINSSIWSFDQVIEQVQIYDGFIFPAHVDAVSYSIIGQLGFVPAQKEIFALGLTANCNLESFLEENEYLKDYCFIQNSDSHYLNQIGSVYTEFYLESPTVSEIEKACLMQAGRKVRLKFKTQKNN
jgi:PHP family Zn ribbon phosphoesterase